MNTFVRLAAVPSLVLAASSCSTNPTTACIYQLSDIVVVLPVGGSTTVANVSRCNTASPKPVSWSGRHPEIATVTSSPDLSQVSVKANAPGEDTVTAEFPRGRSIVFLVRVTPGQ